MLDILFPKVCPSCRTAALKNENLCGLCFSEIRFIDNWSLCRKCGVPFGFFSHDDTEDSQWAEQSGGRLCGKCVQDKYYFEKARSIAIYEGKIRDMIISFKYEGKLSNGEALISI